MKQKRKAGFWVGMALILCAVSMIVSSLIQSGFGKVKVTEQQLMDDSG